ncbi:MAG: EFR1 family ferrodoxin [Bacteroidales bacterium]|nr:EFR1 family ferrodoxin [Candidatus Sodaliphilus fimicaballi]
MIFWFSGTGNSLWVARQLAASLNDTLVDIARASLDGTTEWTLKPGESVGFVFPTHSWGPPPLVCKYAKEMHLNGYTSTTHTWMVTTCGDDIGLTPEILQKALGDIKLNAAYSVQMPNTYICLPGFDVDDFTTEKTKLIAARARVEKVALSIAERRNVTDVVRGSMAWFKSRIIRPGFVRSAMNDSAFKVDADACSKCGLCAKQCPVGNIAIDADGHPQWQGDCTMCLGCLHKCPKTAINYGNITKKKGRYYHKGK